MRILVAVVLAYLLTGSIYVWRKLTSNNYLRMPPFLMRYRAEGGIGRLLAVVSLGWVVVSLINREFGYLLIFATLAGVGFYLNAGL